MRRALSFLVFLLFFSLLTVSNAFAAKRVALVIGNSAYEHSTPLKNPENDANAVSAVLRKLGFEVVTGTDLKHLDFARVVGEFRNKLKGADAGIFYYAGHGLQVNGKNYLVPIDAQLEYEDSIEFEAVTLRAILRLMERESATNIVFLDACRDNPLARNLARGMGTRSTAVGRGMARVEAGIGTMISFATQPGNVALDGEGKNSPFTSALLNHIETPGLDIANLMRSVRLEVLTSTDRKQVPWSNSSLTGSFYFKDRPKEVVDKNAIERTYWQAISSSQDARLYEAYLKQFPDGEYADEARGKIDRIRTLEAARVKAREDAEAKARAEAEARAKAEAQARKEAEARALAEAAAKAEAQARAKAIEEAQERLEAAIRERDAAESRMKAEAEARLQAEQRAKTEADARVRAEAEAEVRTKAAAEADARAELEAKQRAEAQARAEQLAEGRKKAEAEAKALSEARARDEAERRAERERAAKTVAQEQAREEASAAEAAREKVETGKQGQSADAAELAYWNSIKDWGNSKAVEAYLEKYPDGQFAQLAKIALEQIKERQNTKVASLGPVRDVNREADFAFWDSIKLNTRIVEFEAYLKKFPDGQFRELAETKLAILKSREKAAIIDKKRWPYDGDWKVKYRTRGCRVNSGEFWVSIKEGELFSGWVDGTLGKNGAINLNRRPNRSGWGFVFSGRIKSTTGSGSVASYRGRTRSRKCGGTFTMRRPYEDQLTAEAKEKKENENVVSLDTQSATSTDIGKFSALSSRDLTLALQRELQRHGCEPGKADGQWGSKGRAALTRFNKSASMSLNVDTPNPVALNALKGKTDPVCAR